MTRPVSHIGLALSGLVFLAMAACGGGGGGTDPDPEPPGPPTVTSVAPSVSSGAVATLLTIRGTGFEGATGADLLETTTFEVVALVGLTVTADGSCTATVPAGTAAGTYHVRVDTPRGRNETSAQALRVVVAPEVHGVTPSSGFNDRATAITITGVGFTGATGVTLADPATTALTGTIVVDDATITASVPTCVAAGSYDVRVSAPGGTNATSDTPFTARNLVDPDLVGAFNVGFEDGAIPGASGDTPAARTYYPATSSGQGATPDSALAPYHAVVFNHAYKPPAVAGGIDYRSYGYLCGQLASFGYVVISVDMVPNNNLLESVEQNARRDAADARAALNHLATRTTTPGDRLFGLVNTSWAGIGGHSRGGDASLIACADEALQLGAGARFGAVFVLGSPSWDVMAGGGRINFGDFTSVPCLATGATQDLIAPFVDQQDIYTQAGSPSMLFEIVGGNHSRYTDTGQQIPFDGIATIPLTTQQDICRRYVIAWFGYHVKGQTGFFAPYVLAGGTFHADTRIQNQGWK